MKKAPQMLSSQELIELDELSLKIWGYKCQEMLNMTINLGVKLTPNLSDIFAVRRFEVLLSQYMTFVAYQLVLENEYRMMARN